MTLARELVRAVRAASSTSLPEEAATAARLHFLDAIGVGLASAGSPIGAAYRDFAKNVVGTGPSTVLGQSAGASAADAAGAKPNEAIATPAAAVRRIDFMVYPFQA